MPEDEILLQEEPERLTIFPIKYQQLWDQYKAALSAIWTVEEINFSSDLDDWLNLSDNERFFIKNILAFFSSSDTIVNINLSERFINEVKPLEAKFFYAFQQSIESIHSEMYSLLIDTYIKDQKEKHETLNAIKYIPCIARKADWCFKWINDQESPFAQRLIAFAIVEGVFFSGAFCSIFWLKERGKMPGLCFSNELISRDESMHVNFATTLYSMIKNRLPQEVVHNMFTEAVEVEKNFIIESIPCALLGMNSQLMSTYIEFVADRLLVQLDYEKLFNVHNPFPFMERISIETKSNFFENRVAEYSKANVGTKVDHSKIHEFTLDEDF
jgi:ribonucleotide reductase beta subunit family protein with ferritin-like domain